VRTFDVKGRVRELTLLSLGGEDVQSSRSRKRAREAKESQQT
jgi:hypothetical protein